jgi:hypothetical protein
VKRKKTKSRDGKWNEKGLNGIFNSGVVTLDAWFNDGGVTEDENGGSTNEPEECADR